MAEASTLKYFLLYVQISHGGDFLLKDSSNYANNNSMTSTLY